MDESKERRTASINDKEWKKAVFKRWDDFKALKRDVLLRLHETRSAVPEELAVTEKKVSALKNAEGKLNRIATDIENIDDSNWDRHTLSSELSAAMRKVEHARLDCMLISAKLAEKQGAIAQTSSTASPSSIIHEIQSLTFPQCFKLGLGLFFPLIIGIIIGVLLLSLFNYLTLVL